ncbi:hypothetical protein ACFYOF_17075 [Streptomyces sp. NPDC007148]|uniref:hypothetical protein n=1 Tax=Streptomyces sp. NPDC007148 TaxID=3364775 RepID=UPI0036A0D1AE
MAQLSALIDAFAGGSVDASRWNASNMAQLTLDTVNDVVSLNVPTSPGSFNLGSGGPYDATGSYLYAQVTPAPTGNGGITTAMKLDAGSNNYVLAQVSSTGAFQFKVVTAGVAATTSLPAYDPHQHRWWQLFESAGSFTVSTSPDGVAWTPLASAPHAWNATAMQVYFQTISGDTEPSGLVATIANVNTRLGGPDNSNWPKIEDAWAPVWWANGGTFPLDRYVEVTDRTRGTVSISRGRQYELDQVRSGEASLKLANKDAALDPTNASGPYAGHINPYQPYRRRAQWPPTRNLLDQVMATAGDLGGYSLGGIPGGAAGPDIFTETDPSAAFVSSTSAWQGSTVMQFAVPSGTASNTRIVHTPRWSVIPGQTYTVTIRVRNVTASTSVQVKPLLGWNSASGGLNPATFVYGSSATLTGSATAAWTTLTFTATAPADAAGMDVGVALAATAASTCSVQVDGWQLEKGSAATAWACPGVWYPIYAGFMERWPSSWDMNGTYGVVQPTAVDAFSLLSQRQLEDSLTQEINSHTPRFVYRLDDPAGSTSVADWTGQNPAAQLAISKYGAGSLVFGTAITATHPTGTYTGSSGTVATINNPFPGQSVTAAATFIKLSTAGIVGPADPTSWTRMIAFRYTGPLPAAGANMWSCMDNQRGGGVPSGSRIYLFLDSSGKPRLTLAGPGGTAAGFFPGGATNCADGDWHLLIFGYSTATAQVMFSQDGTTASFYGSQPAGLTPTGLISDNLGAFVDATVGNGTSQNFQGDIAFACEFPGLFTTSQQITGMYAAWKAACAGESTDARYSRILRYAGYTGPATLQSGLTTSMGPANFDGQDAMSALQAVVDTENGAHYIDRQGGVQFKARSDRYNALTPMYVFGERADLGEWPYEDAALDFDSTHLSNQVTVTQDGTSQNFYAADSASSTAYFPRSMSRNINASDPNECQDAANYLLSRYKQPSTRVSNIKLHPSANPALWAVCLSLELGMRVRVMRRPPGVPATQVECFLEQMQWDFGDDGEAWLTLQCSPADTTSYGVFASFHTTLNANRAAGVTSITINAGQDNTNVLAAQLAAGQQLVLGQGTANQETVTVSAVAATSPGWTTATITLTAATTKSHTAGDVVCEPLPSGVTDPTTWDAVAQFDSIAFAY